MSIKNEKDKKKLQDDFEKLQNEEPNLNPAQYMVTSEQMPEFGKLEIYDYNKDLEETRKNSHDIIEQLVELYIPEIKDHAYIKYKMKEDARVYASSQFLERMSEKLLVQQLKQIDNGDTSARIFEVVNQTMREDIGLNDLSSITDKGTEIETNLKDDGRIIDTTDLNDKLEQILKDKEKEKNK